MTLELTKTNLVIILSGIIGLSVIVFYQIFFQGGNNTLMSAAQGIMQTVFG